MSSLSCSPSSPAARNRRAKPPPPLPPPPPSGPSFGHFDASGSSADGATQYAWDFGDGRTGLGVKVEHTYNAGRYTATLTVTDSQGQTHHRASKSVAVTGGVSGAVAGSLRFGAEAADSSPDSSELSVGEVEQPFVPGEVIVGFAPSLRAQALESLSVAGTRIEPDLAPRDVAAVLAETARPLSSVSCRRSNGKDCGAGLVDAAAALTLIQEGKVPKEPLRFSPEVLSFGSKSNELELTLTNQSSAELAWRFLRYEAGSSNPGSASEGVLLVESQQGNLSVGEQTTTRVALDRSRVGADGSYDFELVFAANGKETFLPVRFTRQGVTTLHGPMIVAAFTEDSRGDLILSGATEAAGTIRDYAFGVLAGENTLIAWSDENDNLEIDTGDHLGSYSSPVTVEANATLTGLDITLSEVVETKGVGLEAGLLRELERARGGGQGHEKSE